MAYFVPQSTSTPLFPEISSIDQECVLGKFYDGITGSREDKIFQRAEQLKKVFDNNVKFSTKKGLPTFTPNSEFFTLQKELKKACDPNAVPETLFPPIPTDADQLTKPLTFYICDLNKNFCYSEARPSEKIDLIRRGYKDTSYKLETERIQYLQSTAANFHPHINLIYDIKHKRLIQHVTAALAEIRDIEQGDEGEVVKEVALSPVAEHILNTWYRANLSKPYPTPHTYDLLAQAGGIPVDTVQMWFEVKGRD